MQPTENRAPGAGAFMPSASVRFARSRQMIDCLRAEFLYTEKRVRDVVFGEIETLLAARPLAISRLVRGAAGRACRRAERIGVACGNWNVASRATIHAMLAAGVVLRADGSPIPRAE